MALTLPPSISGFDAAPLAKVMSTCPATTSLIAGPAPLYGIWTSLVPAVALNFSSVRWFDEPLPGEAMLSFPGAALSAATISASELNFELTGTTSIRPKVAMLATGARSFAA